MYSPTLYPNSSSREKSLGKKLTLNGYNNTYIKWSYDPRSYESNFSNFVEKPENSGLQESLNPWPRDTGATL